MTRATFRVKVPDRPAADFGFRYECSQAGHSQSGTVLWSQGMGDAWTFGYFRCNACDYCDDVFAEVADIALMDAWLPRYMGDSRGTNLILVRNHSLLDMLVGGAAAEELDLEQVPVQDIVRSQAGVIRIKRDELSHRLHLARHESRGVRLPATTLPPRRLQRLESAVLCNIRQRIRMRGREASRRAGPSSRVAVIRRQTRWLRLAYRLLSALVHTSERARRLLGY